MARLCHSSVVQLYYLLRLWLCVLRLLGSFRTSKTCLRHRRLLKRTMSSLERSSLQLKLCCLRKDLWDSLRSWCFHSRISSGLLLLHFRSHSLPSPSDAVHTERNHMVQVSSLVLHFVPQSPFGRCAVHQQGYGLRLLIFKSRSGSDKKRRNRLQ